jgi:predicted MPP superfamily phosphohydrolase
MRSWYSYLFFFLSMTAVLGGVHYYLWKRLVHSLDLARHLFVGFSVLFWGAFVFLMLSFPVFRFIPLDYQTPIMLVAFTWLGVMFLLLVLLVVRDIALFANRKLNPTPDPDRRMFLKRASALAVGAGAGVLTAYSVNEAINSLHVKEVPVPSSRWPAALKGFKIVQVTDIHVGPTIGRAFMEEMVRRINALEADLVVVTGDLVDGSVANLGYHVEPLGAIRSKYGTFFVAGNHEYYSGLDEWLGYLRSIGLTVLFNERARIGEGEASFDLVGLDDHTGKPDMEAALQGRSDERPLVVLAHQPRSLKFIEPHNPVLQISGHTHAGQIWPFNFLVRLVQPYVGGLYRHNADMHVYVSPGTGYWGPPMRLGTQAEITKLVIG